MSKKLKFKISKTINFSETDETKCVPSSFDLKPYYTKSGKNIGLLGNIFNVDTKVNLGMHIIYLWEFHYHDILNKPIEIDKKENLLSYNVLGFNHQLLVLETNGTKYQMEHNWIMINILTKNLVSGILFGNNIENIYFLNSNQFIQYDDREITTYTITNTTYFAVTKKTFAPLPNELMCLSNGLCSGIYFDQNLPYLEVFSKDLEVTNTVTLPSNYKYRFAVCQYNDIDFDIIGFSKEMKLVKYYHSILKKKLVFNISYNVSDSFEGHVNYNKYRNILTLLDYNKNQAIKSSYSLDGILLSSQIEKLRNGYQSPICFAASSVNTIEPESYYLKNQQVSWLVGKHPSDLLKFIVASRLANYVFPSNFPKMFFLENKNQSKTEITITFEDFYVNKSAVRCDIMANATLYSMASVLGMKIVNHESIKCFQNDSSNNLILYFSDFSNAASFKWDGETDLSNKSSYPRLYISTEDDESTIEPYPHMQCDPLLPCNGAPLKAVYKTIYQKLNKEYKQMIDSIGCAAIPSIKDIKVINGWTPEEKVETNLNHIKDIVGSNLEKIALMGLEATSDVFDQLRGE